MEQEFPIEINTTRGPYFGSTFKVDSAGPLVRLVASWRKSPAEVVAASLVCLTLSSLAFAFVWSGMVPVWTTILGLLPMVLLAAYAAYVVRCSRRPLVTIVSVHLGNPVTIEVPGAGDAARLHGVASLKALFRPSIDLHDGQRKFVDLLGTTQVVATMADGSEVVLLRVIDQRGLPIWSEQRGLCDRLNRAFSRPT